MSGADMPPLEDILEAVTAGRRMSVCVTDLMGILRYEKLGISEKYRIHSSHFCSDTAKSTSRGLALCLECKDKANRLAKEGKFFCGRCRFGVCEAVCPVIFEGRVRCIVYCGGYDTGENEGLAKLKSACAKARVAFEPAVRTFEENTEKAESDEPYMKIARFIGDCIRRILSEASYGNKMPAESFTDYIRRYSDLEYASELSLEMFSRMLFVNPKHLGRLFKRDTGVSFKRYLSNLRLGKAKWLLETSDMSVTEISLSVGFGSAAYFNRVFRDKYGCTPTDLRKST